MRLEKGEFRETVFIVCLFADSHVLPVTKSKIKGAQLHGHRPLSPLSMGRGGCSGARAPLECWRGQGRRNAFSALNPGALRGIPCLLWPHDFSAEISEQMQMSTGGHLDGNEKPPLYLPQLTVSLRVPQARLHFGQNPGLGSGRGLRGVGSFGGVEEACGQEGVG